MSHGDEGGVDGDVEVFFWGGGGGNHSVLLRFTAPGSFSCNLEDKRESERSLLVNGIRAQSGREAIGRSLSCYAHLLGDCGVDLSACQVDVLINLGLKSEPQKSRLTSNLKMETIQSHRQYRATSGEFRLHEQIRGESVL